MRDCILENSNNMTFGQSVPDDIDVPTAPRTYRTLSMITPKLKANEERKKLIRICSQKLEKIKDPDINLRRSVCINNTYCRLRDEVRKEKEFKRGTYTDDFLHKSYDDTDEYIHDTDGSFLDKTIEVSESDSNYRNDLMEICEEAAKDECENVQGSSFSLDLANAFKIRTRELDVNRCSGSSDIDSVGSRQVMSPVSGSGFNGNPAYSEHLTSEFCDGNKDYYVLRKLGEPNDSKQIVRELESIDKELEKLPCFQPPPYQDLIPNALLDVLDSASMDTIVHSSRESKCEIAVPFSSMMTPTKSLSNFESSFNAFCKYSYSEFESIDSETDQSSNDSVDDDMVDLEPSPKRLCMGLQSFTNSATCGDAFRQVDTCGQTTHMDNSQTSVFVS